MFDIGFPEMAIVVVIALLVVGPKDLPKVLRTVRAWVAKARSMARDFQDGVDDLVRESELKELKDEIQEATKDQLTGEFDDFVNPTGDFLDDDVEVDPSDTNKIAPPKENTTKKSVNETSAKPGGKKRAAKAKKTGATTAANQ